MTNHLCSGHVGRHGGLVEHPVKRWKVALKIMERAKPPQVTIVATACVLRDNTFW